MDWLAHVRDGLAGLGLLGVPGGIVLWWLRDRRKDKAVAEVAERTVDADVIVKDAGGWQAQLAYTTAAFDRERQSLTDAIDFRDSEIERLRAENAHKDEVIALMRVQVQQLEEQLSTASRQIVAFRQRLDELAGTDPTNQVPNPRKSS